MSVSLQYLPFPLRPSKVYGISTLGLLELHGLDAEAFGIITLDCRQLEDSELEIKQTKA